MNKEQLMKLIRKHEGLRLYPYMDTENKLTIGYGRNLEDRGISLKTAVDMLEEDVELALKESKKHEFFYELDDVRQNVIIEMIFNLGPTRFRGFKRMISALNSKDYSLAASEMLDSLWAKQVGPRANRLSDMMKTGKFL